MRIALLGAELCADSRASNIASAMELIDQAARSDPGPDLVVLPGGCDRPTGAVQGCSPAMIESYTAALCAKAREWGIYVAAARREWVKDRDSEVASLTDPDGDELFVHPTTDDTNHVDTVSTSIGSIGLCFSGFGLQPTSTMSTHGHVGDLMIVFGEPVSRPTHSGISVGSPAAVAAEQGTWVCLVRAWRSTIPTQGGFVFSDESKVSRCVETPGGRIVTAEIPSKVNVTTS